MKKTLFTASSVALLCLVGVQTYSVVEAQGIKGPETLDDSCWQTSFEDSFDELSLIDETATGDNQGRWRTRFIWERETIINEELQFYIDPAFHGVSPFSISNSILSITAQPTPRALRGLVAGQPYVSGLLTTQKSFSQLYGRFEALAKVPEGQGFWSAFWLLPTHERWPEGVAVLPEIDVVEHLGHQPNVFHTTLHTNQTGPLTSHPYDHTEDKSLTDSFHLYTVVWTETSVNWYLDGQWRAAHPTPKDMTHPVHFLVNLAVGGHWPGPPDKTTEFPAHFEVDYIRAYTRKDACGE